MTRRAGVDVHPFLSPCFYHEDGSSRCRAGAGRRGRCPHAPAARSSTLNRSRPRARGWGRRHQVHGGEQHADGHRKSAAAHQHAVSCRRARAHPLARGFGPVDRDCHGRCLGGGAAGHECVPLLRGMAWQAGWRSLPQWLRGRATGTASSLQPSPLTPPPATAARRLGRRVAVAAAAGGRLGAHREQRSRVRLNRRLLRCSPGRFSRRRRCLPLFRPPPSPLLYQLPPLPMVM